jgi:hypothetical protein
LGRQSRAGISKAYPNFDAEVSKSARIGKLGAPTRRRHERDTGVTLPKKIGRPFWPAALSYLSNSLRNKKDYDVPINITHPHRPQGRRPRSLRETFRYGSSLVVDYGTANHAIRLAVITEQDERLLGLTPLEK